MNGEFIGGCDIVTELFGTTELHKKLGIEIDIAAISTAMNDPSPFTLLAFVLGVAKRRFVEGG